MSTEIRSNNKINEMINTKEIPPRNGNPLEVFKVADAVNADEALSKGQLLNEIKNVDGSNSGIDADKLDGHDSAYFLPASDLDLKIDMVETLNLTGAI